MISREQLRSFREATWGAADADAFLASVSDVDAAEIWKLLEGIATRPLAVADGVQVKLRCRVVSGIVARNPDKSLFAPFTKMLKTADGPLRDLLVQLMPTVNDIAGHAELGSYLRAADPKLRAAASEVLRRIGGKTAFDVVLAAARDASCAGRIEALDALLPMSGHHALPALQSVLSNGKTPEKLHALKYLGDPKFMAKASSSAAKTIVTALADSTEPVVLAAIVALGGIASEDDYFEATAAFLDAQNLALVKATLEGLRNFKSPRVVSTLTRKLTAGPNRIRLAALATAEAIGVEEIMPVLVDALGHKQLAVRQAAGESLMRLSSSGRVDMTRTIVWLLRSEDVNVRRIAADLARTVKDAKGDLWLKLVSHVRDADWWVRERIVDALVEMAGTKLTRYFLHFLSDKSPVMRRFGVDILGKAKDPDAIQPLLQVAARDPDWWVAERAIEAIAGFKDERAVPVLLQVPEMRPELTVATVDALAAMRASAAIPQVVAMLALPDPDVRLAALRFVEAVGHRAPAEVEPLLKAEEAEVRAQAARLLAYWQAAAASIEARTTLERYLIRMAENDCDDLLLEAGVAAYAKRVGRVVPLMGEPLTDEGMRSLLHPILDPEQIAKLGNHQDLDFSFEIPDKRLRFRVNVFHQRGGLAAVFRVIKAVLPKLESLGLPEQVRALGDAPHGLVLVGGPTGSGKSTTLAALVNYINETYPRHILTLEDPVEVVHQRKQGLVIQREIGTHARTFERALRASLREDPDVILVGEMRDLDTIRFAVTAADTGHLVFATVHTASADTAIDRLVNAFPAGEQGQIRSSLASSLRAVVCQYLLRRADGNGRVLALEILLNNEAVTNLIRKEKTYQLTSLIATGRDQGMQSMDTDLLRLAKAGIVSAEEAYMRARSKKEFEVLFGVGQSPGDKSGNGAAAAPNAPATGARPAAPAGQGTPRTRATG